MPAEVGRASAEHGLHRLWMFNMFCLRASFELYERLMMERSFRENKVSVSKKYSNGNVDTCVAYNVSIDPTLMKW
jgi:hypothetical protein